MMGDGPDVPRLPGRLPQRPDVEAQPPAERRDERATGMLLGVALAGCAVSLSLGAYGGLHDPTGIAVNVAGFSGPMEVKVWLATLATLLAVVQLGSGLAMYGRLPGVTRAPDLTPGLHRWSGRLAFLSTVPVAMHCLYALGFQSYDTRTLAHSLLGCLFFGAFTTKMLALTRRDLPTKLLPLLGGTVFALLVGLWLTSSLWFFTTVGVRL
jgi:hypothetical protein